MVEFKINYFSLAGWGFIFFLAGIVAFFIYFPDYSRLKKLRKENTSLRKSIVSLKKNISGLHNNLIRLNNDPSFWEHLARKNLQVVKKGEIIVDIHNK